MDVRETENYLSAGDSDSSSGYLDGTLDIGCYKDKEEIDIVREALLSTEIMDEFGHFNDSILSQEETYLEEECQDDEHVTSDYEEEDPYIQPEEGRVKEFYQHNFGMFDFTIAMEDLFGTEFYHTPTTAASSQTPPSPIQPSIVTFPTSEETHTEAFENIMKLIVSNEKPIEISDIELAFAKKELTECHVQPETFSSGSLKVKNHTRINHHRKKPYQRNRPSKVASSATLSTHCVSMEPYQLEGFLPQGGYWCVDKLYLTQIASNSQDLSDYDFDNLLAEEEETSESEVIENYEFIMGQSFITQERYQRRVHPRRGQNIFDPRPYCRVDGKNVKPKCDSETREFLCLKSLRNEMERIVSQM